MVQEKKKNNQKVGCDIQKERKEKKNHHHRKTKMKIKIVIKRPRRYHKKGKT